MNINGTYAAKNADSLVMVKDGATSKVSLAADTQVEFTGSGALLKKDGVFTYTAFDGTSRELGSDVSQYFITGEFYIRYSYKNAEDKTVNVLLDGSLNEVFSTTGSLYYSSLGLVSEEFFSDKLFTVYSIK